MLVSDIANPWFGQLAGLVERALRQHGYSLLICDTAEDPKIEAHYLRLLRERDIDGMILVPVLRTRQTLSRLVRPRFPLVLLDRPITGVAASVATDQDQAAGLLCETLSRAGVRRIALVSGPRDIVTHRRRAQITSRRFKVVDTYEGPAQKETGRRAFIRFALRHADAVVCTNNFLGQGVIDAMEEIDNPPIIGCFDELPTMHLLPLPIVCVMQDVPLLADGCVRQLLPQLRGEKARLSPILLPARAVTNRAFQRRQSAPF
jgi:LacI family transcriptional regulator